MTEIGRMYFKDKNTKDIFEIIVYKDGYVNAEFVTRFSMIKKFLYSFYHSFRHIAKIDETNVRNIYEQGVNELLEVGKNISNNDMFYEDEEQKEKLPNYIG